jgi:hypothetical protein
MRRHAIVNKDNIVVNVILWDGESPWKPPVDHFVVQDDNVDSGDIFQPEVKSFYKVINLSKDE